MTSTSELAEKLLEASTMRPPGISLSEVLARLEKYITARQPIIETLPCGWGLLDTTVGGLIRGEFVGVIAMPGVGKSTLVDKVTVGALRLNPGTHALVFALETAPAVRVARLVAGESVTVSEDEVSSSAPLDGLLRGGLSEEGREHARATIQRLATEVGGRLRFIDNVENAAEIAQIIRDEQPDIVVIDHLGLVTAGSMTESDTTRLDSALGEIGRALKEVKSAAIIINEVNKESAKEGRIDLVASRGSARFASLAAVFVALRVKHRHPNPQHPIIEAALLKNRHGLSDQNQEAEFHGWTSHFEWQPLDPTDKELDDDARRNEAVRGEEIQQDAHDEQPSGAEQTSTEGDAKPPVRAGQ